MVLNKLNFRKHSQQLRVALAGILALALVLGTGVQSHASNPDAAYIHQIGGTDLFIGTGASSSRQQAQLRTQLRGNNTLYVPGGKRGWAKLGFIVDAPLDNTGLLVQAGPDNVVSEWSFPCTASGGLKISWKKGSDRGCEEGVRMKRSGSQRSRLTLPDNSSLQSAKNIFKAQAESEEVVFVPPNSEEKIIQTRDSGAGIEVETIEGDILVKSAKYPQGRLISEGQKYSYPQDTITPIDRYAIANSPEMQDFLNPKNWQFPDIPERIAGGIANQLREHRQALGLNQTAPVIGKCDQQQNAQEGGNEVSTIPFKLSANRGTINIAYNMFEAPDKLEVIYEGRVIWSTEQVPGNQGGFVSGSNTVPISFQGNSDEVTVKVTGNQTIITTQWEYTLSCSS